jgi:hypothetical protein
LSAPSANVSAVIHVYHTPIIASQGHPRNFSSCLLIHFTHTSRSHTSPSLTSKQQQAFAVAALSAAALAVAPAAQAAQEAMMLAEGEPAIVQFGWAATAAMFTFSISLVVWGRSGM